MNNLHFSPMDLADFDDVIAAAEEYLPSILKLILGKSNVQNGLQMILQYFQDPLLNKQVNRIASLLSSLARFFRSYFIKFSMKFFYKSSRNYKLIRKKAN